MIFRVAGLSDIAQMRAAQNSVSENVQLNADFASDEVFADYLTARGHGWVCAINEHVIGFAIADLLDDCIRALYVRPEFENIGIGTRLHNTLLNWYFKQSKDKAWASTAAGTKAERFFRNAGWTQIWISPAGEIRFEITASQWQEIKEHR